MIIIYDGQLCITTEVDHNGQEFVVEYIGKGTVINAHNFLSNRVQMNNIRCLTAVSFYYLPVNKLRDISFSYPELSRKINEEWKTQKYNRLLDLNPLDYIEVYFKADEKYDLSPGMMKSMRND